MDYASGVQTNSGTEHEETTMAYIGKFNYDYMGKYLFEYACRYDGSYRYAPGKDGRSLLLYQPAGESLKKALSKIIFVY